jgi:hypothetical protein
VIVSISQPAYLPWLGYFSRIANSDLAVVLDNVMLERSSTTRFTNRNKIKTVQGPIWLTVPVKTAGLGQPLISEVAIDADQGWGQKHVRAINQAYGKTKFYLEHKDWFDFFYKKQWTHLAPMLRESTSYLLEAVGIKTPRVLSSNFNVVGEKSDLILNICRHVGAKTYISGPFGRDYLDLLSFKDSGINVVFDEYTHPVYPQLHGNFEPYMSVIDLLFNCGADSLTVLRNSHSGMAHG